MAIAPNPKRTHQPDAAAERFISKSAPAEDALKTPITLRVPPDILDRIDRAAKRLGITRTAFLVSSAAERLERMENG